MRYVTHYLSILNTSRSHMPETITVYINGNEVLKYEKPSRRTGIERRFLDEMDMDLDEGIHLNDEVIESPDKMQRASYVAMSLLYGIESENNEMVSIACAYLANRLPGLKQVRATEQGDDGENVTLDFIFDEVN